VYRQNGCPGGIQENPHVVPWLVVGQLGTQPHCVGGCLLKGGDLEVQVDHHLLAPVAAGHTGRT